MFYRQFMSKMRFKKKKKKKIFGIKQKNGNFKPSIPFLHRKTTNFTGLWALGNFVQH